MKKIFKYPALMLTALTLSLSLGFSSTSQARIKQSSAKADGVLLQHLMKERVQAGLQSKTRQVGEIQWSYNEGGHPSKPTIVLIHGLAGTKDNWNRVAQFLTPYYHVIALDLPTNGDTKIPEHFDFSIPNVTSQLRLFLETLGFEKNVHVAGHSLGGSIATVYASQYPFDTQSLFLVNSAGIYKDANTPYAKDPHTLKHLIVTKLGDLQDVSKKLMQNPPFVPAKIRSAQEKWLISRSDQTSKAIDQVVMLSRIYTPDSFARLARTVEAPTLILWGKQDQIINVEVAQELHTLLKRAERPVILNNVGHMPIIEAEKQVAQHYLPFLAKTQTLKNPLADKLIPLL